MTDLERIAEELIEYSKVDPVTIAKNLGMDWTDAMDREWARRYKRCEGCFKWIVRTEFPFCMECNAW